MRKSAIKLFIPLIILFLPGLILFSIPGAALGWTESDVNTAFRLLVHTTKNDYPGGGSQNTSEGFGYRIENWVVEPKAGYIRFTTMNRSDCPGEVAKFRLEWSFSKDISVLAGWTTDERTWNKDLFVATVQILEDGGVNTCIKANPQVRIIPTGIFYVKPDGPTYYNPQGHPDHVPGQRNVYIGQPFYADGGFRINIDGFPGLSYSALYTFQGSREDRAAVCDQYARLSIEQNQENLGRKCGYSGTAWHSDYNSHYNWCMTAERTVINSETRSRDEQLRKCGGGVNKSQCDQYARTAIAQNQENQNRRCGYSGAAWHSDYNGHFNWCMGVDSSAADSETRIRDEELKKCGTKPFIAGKWKLVAGYCAPGEILTITQMGDQVTSISSKGYCSGGEYAEYEATNIQWQSGAALTYRAVYTIKPPNWPEPSADVTWKFLSNDKATGEWRKNGKWGAVTMERIK